MDSLFISLLSKLLAFQFKYHCTLGLYHTYICGMQTVVQNITATESTHHGQTHPVLRAWIGNSLNNERHCDMLWLSTLERKQNIAI